MFQVSTLIFVRIAVLLSLAFFMVKDVSIILNHNFTLLFTEAMHLPALVISPLSAQLGFMSVLLAFSAISDLIPLMEKNFEYFDGVVPARTLFYFGFVAYSYLTTNLFFHNNLVFLYLFVESMIHMSIYSALREDKNERVKKQIQEMQLEEELKLEEEEPVSEEVQQ